MPNNERGASAVQAAGVVGERASLLVEQRERLEEADKLAALIQFALTGRDIAEVNREVQAGCALVLDQIRDAVRGVVTQ